MLFLLPWGEHWLVGTTDTEWTGDRDDPRATAQDVDYLLDQANRWLVRPLTRDDVVGVYAGLRPLVAAAGRSRARPRSCPASTWSPGPRLVWWRSPAGSTRRTG